VPIDEVKTAHYTVCQKPWDHCGHGSKTICEGFHVKWWEARNELETSAGISATPRCGGGSNYSPLALEHFQATVVNTPQMSQVQGRGRDGQGKGSMKVAVVISITKEPPAKGGYLDGAAVLAHAAKQHLAAFAKADLIALCGPDAKSWRAGAMEDIARAGWEPRAVELPVKVEDIEGANLKRQIVKSGCCGPAELVKLHVFELTAYDRVLSLDADTLIMQPIDELFEETEHHAIWTVDRELGGNCVNGGFLMLTPSAETYQGIVATIKKGDFRDGSGWGGKGIGWCYGGQTFQGVIPYYFQHVHKASKSWREADSCLYNNMGDNTNSEGRRQDGVPIDEVKTAHYTVCQKPWDHCHPGQLRNALCDKFHVKWWEARNELEDTRGLSKTPRCTSGNYWPLQ